jgi:hypothetical protein
MTSHGGEVDPTSTPAFSSCEIVAGGSVKHAASSRSKTRETPMNRGKGNAGAKKLSLPPKAAMAERTMRRRCPRKLTTVAVNPLEAS